MGSVPRQHTASLWAGVLWRGHLSCMGNAGARSDSAGQTGSFLNMAPEVVLGKPYDQKCGGLIRLCLANMLSFR